MAVKRVFYQPSVGPLAIRHYFQGKWRLAVKGEGRAESIFGKES